MKQRSKKLKTELWNRKPSIALGADLWVVFLLFILLFSLLFPLKELT